MHVFIKQKVLRGALGVPRDECQITNVRMVKVIRRDRFASKNSCLEQGRSKSVVFNKVGLQKLL